jgi:YjbE family integral membrane protein
MELLLELNWFAVGQIILIDLLLGGDNAIIIALACRNLPPRLRIRGILWGTFGAIVLRIVLVSFAVTLLQMPYLKLVGGLLLFWIGIKLLSDDDSLHDDVHASDRLWVAVRTIIIADVVMSVDNVIAIASTAEQMGGQHQLLLVVFGVAVSIPIIIWGSKLVLALMDRYAWVITGGAALLGYLAGSIAFSDKLLTGVVPPSLMEVSLPGTVLSLPGVVGAIIVVSTGTWMAKRKAALRRRADT